MNNRLELHINQLLNYRGSKVQMLLKPISKAEDGPAWAFAPGEGNIRILGTHDGSTLSFNFSQWRFKSIVRCIFIMYYERWKLSIKNQCFIERAYLQIYKVNKKDETEQEIVCLHCDLDEPQNSELYIYKCIPHIHMQTAEYPINRSHIPLALGHIDSVLNSFNDFNDFLKLCIQFIRDEILRKYDEHVT